MSFQAYLDTIKAKTGKTPEDLRQLAEKRVPRAFFQYVDSGSYAEETFRANRADMEREQMGAFLCVAQGTPEEPQLVTLEYRKALAVIHRETERAWTLESLAQIAGMSRASFAQRFSELVGTTPIEYLTRWRMTQAELLLRNPRVSVAIAAERVGYETEAAFRKAFKRVHGVGPGSIRRWFREKLS